MTAPGFWEIIFLAVLALMIFGPDRLPKLARGAGQALSQFKREASGTLDELKAAAELEEFRDVARDLRSTTADLRGAADVKGLKGAVGGAVALGAAGSAGQRTKPRTAAMKPAGRTAAPPFDPDTP